MLTAPGPRGGLWVLIPDRKAPAVLALLDSTGTPRPGWPVSTPGATSCDQLLPVADGSVRVICSPDNPDGSTFTPIGAFAFDENAHPLGGWPVTLEASFVTGRVIGDDLTLFTVKSLGYDSDEGQPSSEGGLVTVTSDGTVTSGSRVPLDGACCYQWAVGPDGVAYGSELAKASFDGAPEESQVTALDLAGIRAGWPVRMKDSAAGPTFLSDGRIAVLVGSLHRSVSHVVVLDPSGNIGPTSSKDLPLTTAMASGDTGGCGVSSPLPVAGTDATITVFSEVDAQIYALDGSLAVVPGWPFETQTALVRARPGSESEHEAGYCPGPVSPAIGPDGTLFLTLEARKASAGGSLVAVGPDGRVRPGWPVELKRRGAEFWSVVVGSDGTAFAVAIEPEASGASSATILAIAPDSTVLWTTTIVEP